jgi:hypothetical protein
MRPFPFLLLLACAACVACAATARAPARPKPAPPANDTLAQIRALIGNAACTNASQCHTIGIGARPCGGPQAYLAWSSATTDGAALAALAEKFKLEREAANAASGELSNCRYFPDPGAVCRAGTCELNPTTPDGNSAV